MAFVHADWEWFFFQQRTWRGQFQNLYYNEKYWYRDILKWITDVYILSIFSDDQHSLTASTCCLMAVFGNIRTKIPMILTCVGSLVVWYTYCWMYSLPQQYQSFFYSVFQVTSTSKHVKWSPWQRCIVGKTEVWRFNFDPQVFLKQRSRKVCNVCVQV